MQSYYKISVNFKLLQKKKDEKLPKISSFDSTQVTLDKIRTSKKSKTKIYGKQNKFPWNLNEVTDNQIHFKCHK
jgi:hypothetical protein